MRECNALEAHFCHPGMFTFPLKKWSKNLLCCNTYLAKSVTLIPFHPLVFSLTVSVALGFSAEQTSLYSFNFSIKIVTVKSALIQRNGKLYQGVLVLKKKLVQRNRFFLNNRDGFPF